MAKIIITNSKGDTQEVHTEPVQQSRTERLKEQYNRLRKAGYSSEEARKLRSKTLDEIDKAIAEKGGLAVVQEQTPAQEPSQAKGGKGNKAWRLEPGEIEMVKAIRAAIINPKQALELIAKKLENDVEEIVKAGLENSFIKANLDEKIEILRRG